MNRQVRELIVSIFILGGAVLVVFGYFWFSGRWGMRYSRQVTIYFSEISGLKPGDRVDVLGVTKGRVLATELTEGNKVRVRVALADDVRLSRDAHFAIRSLSYLGSDRYLEVDPGLGDLAVDTAVFYGENEVINLEAAFLKLDRIMSMVDPDSLSAELRHARAELMEMVNLRLAGIDSGFTQTNRNIERLTGLIDSLALFLRRESFAWKMLTSSELYEDILKTSRELRELMYDIRSRPERYFRVRLFR